MEKCYICESERIALLGIVNNFSIYRCKHCGLKWADGITKEQIMHFYEKSYFNSDFKIGYKDYLAQEKNHRMNARNILNLVNRVRDLNHFKILDIGCAFGLLLDEARKFKNCYVYGVELSRYAYEYAKNKLGLNIQNLDFSSAHFVDEFFDIVFMIGTIEHLISPKDTIIIVNKILKPHGLLVVVTIDTAGLFPIYSIKPPEHLFYFNHYNISLFFKKFGFKTVARKTHFAYYYLYDLLHRLANFSSVPFLNFLSQIMRKKIPNFYIKIPTNEMVLIAKKVNIL